MATLKHSETFRGDSSIFFLMERGGNVVLTNLPIQDVPLELLHLETSIEAQSVLAVTAAHGHDLKRFVQSGLSVAFNQASESFRSVFFKTPLEAGKTLVLSKADVSDWLKSQVIWRRDLTMLAGEER